jgi:hypothetical protein
MTEIFQYMQSLGVTSGFCTTTSVVPSNWSCLVLYSCEYQTFSHVWYIFIWSHACNLFSVQGQSATSNNPNGSFSPSSNQSNRPLRRWSLSDDCETYVCQTCDTYVCVSTYVCEKLVRFVGILRYMVSMMYVMILWTLWCICDDYVIYVLSVLME